MLEPRFQIGDRVATDNNETGVVYAIFYTEEPSGSFWSKPGFTYFIHFTIPRTFDDTAHESELRAAL